METDPPENNSDEQEETESSLHPKEHRSRRREKSVTGAIMTGIAKGFQFVFEKEKDNRPAVIQEADDPNLDKTSPVALSLDADNPKETVIKIRPWLMNKKDEDDKNSKD